MNYRVLFLGYWNLDDGLTHATIFPHLRILKEMPTVKYLHFANTQREKQSSESLKYIKELGIGYTGLFSKNLPFNQLNKIYDFVHFPKLILELCERQQINFIIARGAPAGSLAYLVWKNNQIPFVVESFEPHADYMLASTEWKSYGLRYCFQKFWEEQQKKYSNALITVAINYKDKLIKEGVQENKIFVAPCAVDSNLFYPSADLRQKMRENFRIPSNSIVGVYAGKFGGLYLEEEAFSIFQEAFEQIENFYLLILSGTNNHWIEKQIEQHKLPKERIIIQFVPYKEVNSYLNIADFAFALYKNNHVSSYLSPVKIGEYWAVGLPVVTTDKLGDEQYFIEGEKLGIIIRNNNWASTISNFFNVNTERRKINNTKMVYQSILY